MPAPATHAAPPDQARTRQRAARRATFSAAPDLFFATHFLPAARRDGLDSLAAVLLQLRQIMVPAQSPASTPSTAASPAAPHADACHDAGGACPHPASAPAPGAAPGAEGGSAPACTSNPADCAACGGETPERRRMVCSSVLDYLLDGQITGKPELDGFCSAARSAALSRADLDRFCDGLALEATLPRYATWARLRHVCEETAGVAALLAFSVLRASGPVARGSAGRAPAAAPVAAPTADRIHDQVLAWGSAMRLSVLLQSIGRDVRSGRLMLPLDDLVKFGVKESEVASRAAAGRLPPDDAFLARWRPLMEFEIERARRLYDGGLGCLDALDPRGRRAAAVLGELHQARLSRLERGGYDAFQGPPAPRLWDRLSVLPTALRRGMRPR